MKTKRDREEIIKDINVLLHSAYDSTLDEILALLKKIDDEEDEEDIRDARAELEDLKMNGGIPWAEIKRDLKKDVA
ncbi:hypothetical protein WA1_24540 [Scytonema hofmannii PCC 7110]|uniref:Addiction module protein n=1 Tax=Scytonema hofmannii PCC 7110 TaxID=128403 RepID=A0A139X7Z4_9CYAN|nr:hypothetical protein [Scytonema hofmannii]KYC40796.1 hypothetical protein WA1_24540 [Scytonema hofmannii PCC 7110]